MPRLPSISLPSRPITLLLTALVLLGMPLLITYPVLSLEEWYKALQAYRYPYLEEEFYNVFTHGTLYPRWLPNLMGGYGYPTFVYYQPGVFFYLLIFRLFIPDIILAVKLGVFCMFFIGGLGMYNLARLYCRPLFSLVCVALYLAMEQFASVLNLFGNYSELFGGLLCPWVLFFTVLVARRIESRGKMLWPLVGLTFSAAALTSTHPFVTYFFMPALGVLFVGLLMQMEKSRRKHFFIAVGVCMAMALAMTSPYWFTIWQLSGEVRYYRQFQEFRTIGLPELFTGLFDPGPPLHHAFTGDPKYWVYYFTLAYLGVALGLLRKPRLFLAALVCLLFWGFLTTKYSVWLWYNFPLMKFTQFPRRLVSGFTAIMMFCAIQAIARLDEQHALSKDALRRKLIVVVAVLISFIPLTNIFRIDSEHGITYQRSHMPRRLVHYDQFVERTDGRFSDMTHSHEFSPVYSRHHRLRHRMQGNGVPLAEVLIGRAKVIFEEPENPYRIAFKVHTQSIENPNGIAGRQQLPVAINQLYIKGWKVLFDGNRVPFVPRGQDAKAPFLTVDYAGRMILWVPRTPGTYEVEAWYEGPPYWQWRNLVIFLIVGSGIAILYYTFRRDRQSSTVPA